MITGMNDYQKGLSVAADSLEFHATEAFKAGDDTVAKLLRHHRNLIRRKIQRVFERQAKESQAE